MLYVVSLSWTILFYRITISYFLYFVDNEFWLRNFIVWGNMRDNGWESLGAFSRINRLVALTFRIKSNKSTSSVDKTISQQLFCWTRPLYFYCCCYVAGVMTLDKMENHQLLSLITVIVADNIIYLYHWLFARQLIAFINCHIAAFSNASYFDVSKCTTNI